MGVSKAEFARMCGKSRQAIHNAVKKSPPLVMESADGSIDPTYPLNREYLERHCENAERTNGRKADVGRESSGYRPGGGSRPKGSRSSKGNSNGSMGRGIKIPQDMIPGSHGGQEKVKQVNINTRILKERLIELRIKNAERWGILINRDVIESLAGELFQSFRTNFIDPQTKWANQICMITGTPDKLNEVEEYLERDVRRGAEDMIRSIMRLKEINTKEIKKRNLQENNDAPELFNTPENPEN